jgi:chromosome condensin MukBEF complex kleisin-like MukF subunit
MARNRTNKPQPVPRNRMGSLIEEFVAWMRVRNFSFYTQNCRRSYLVRFARWANERGIEDPMEVTRPCWRAISVRCTTTGRRTESR